MPQKANMAHYGQIIENRFFCIKMQIIEHFCMGLAWFMNGKMCAFQW